MKMSNVTTLISMAMLLESSSKHFAPYDQCRLQGKMFNWKEIKSKRKKKKGR